MFLRNTFVFKSSLYKGEVVTSVSLLFLSQSFIFWSFSMRKRGGKNSLHGVPAGFPRTAPQQHSALCSSATRPGLAGQTQCFIPLPPSSSTPSSVSTTSPREAHRLQSPHGGFFGRKSSLTPTLSLSFPPAQSRRRDLGACRETARSHQQHSPGHCS